MGWYSISAPIVENVFWRKMYEINNLTLDEILHYGGLGEITISSPEGWKLLEGLISDYVGTQAERLIDEDRQAYDEGWAECVKHYEIEE